MLLTWCTRVCGFGLLALVVCSSVVATAAEPPKVIRHVVVYGEKGRFAGWPANHGMWSWGDEILVGFSRGYYKDRGPYHHINKEKPEEFLLARSRDGGVDLVGRAAAAAGCPGRHARACATGIMPPGVSPEQPTDLKRPDRFHPSRLRHDRPHGEHERRERRDSISRTTAAIPGEALTGCRFSARKGSWAAPT